MVLGYGFSDLRLVINEWANMGVFDILLPFVLVFAVVFSILQQAGILGKRRGIDATVAFVISLFVIANRYVSELFLPIFSNAGLAIIFMVAIFLIMGLFINKDESPLMFRGILAFGGVAVFLWLMKVVTQTYGIWIFPQNFWINNAPWIIPILMTVLFIAFIMWEPGKNEEKKPEQK